MFHRHICMIYLLLTTLSCGCVMMEVGVTNPIPDMRRIAIIPFLNLSNERAVDGRRFAEMYFSELQKTPGFQVLPVGVVETAIQDNKLNLDDPREIPKLAKLLNVDSIVVGAVTEYSPYYPPRIGVQISWYSTENFRFVPGIPIDPSLREQEDALLKQERKLSRYFYRGQSPDPKTVPAYEELPAPSFPKQDAAQSEDAERNHQDHSKMNQHVVQPMAPSLDNLPMPEMTGKITECQVENCHLESLPEPIMSYSRIYDGSDSELVANLRDYVELSGDQRSGGWEGYLLRSDDFIRYCMHRMIVEMIQLHGGETRRKVVFAKRRLK